MPKIDACRNGCGKQVYVKQDPNDGKWKPYDASTEALHDCPKSPYNLKKQQGEAYRTPKPNELDDFQRRVLDKLELLERKLNAVYSGRAFQDEEDVEQVA